jgi:hypothetical protein
VRSGREATTPLGWPYPVTKEKMQASALCWGGCVESSYTKN